MRTESYWQLALERSATALARGALVPLATELVQLPAIRPFVLRRLLSRTPKHLRAGGPKANPFLPWEAALEVARPRDSHVLLLNKYPVQPAHLLLITSDWQPQDGWLLAADWSAQAVVAADTGGLWFFNSCPAAGASQPHRHLQLLPRHAGECSCPLANSFLAELAEPSLARGWSYRLDRRQDPATDSDLPELYRSHALALGLGDPLLDAKPLHPYNLLFDDQWFLTVRRRQEHAAGFSVNALGFAGFLLQTQQSDRAWLEAQGAWSLLAAVASPAEIP